MQYRHESHAVPYDDFLCSVVHRGKDFNLILQIARVRHPPCRPIKVKPKIFDAPFGTRLTLAYNPNSRWSRHKKHM
jgi:hypothetical protein